MNRSQQSKRKFPSSGLQRRVRARKDEPEPDDFADEQDYQSDSSQQEEDDRDDDEEDASDGEPLSGSAMDEDNSESGDDDAEPALAASQISFGALAKAQASLPAASRRKHQKPGEDDDQNNSDGSGSDSDSSPEEFDRHGKKTIKPVAGRAHKHAPAEMTSKKPVTRRRQVVEGAGVARKAGRDPRFGPPLQGTAADEERAQDALRRNYAFLGDYRDGEMKALRATVKKTRDPFEKGRLERELASMQSRKQAQERRDAERRVVEEHRKKEKELVRSGAKENPFYLKKSEQRKRVLTERFAGMKKRQVDKAIVRRRKKEVAKERKELPMERRAR
ncbi:rRNA biogenesis protein rrp36 [Pestalotiopsis sp. IQ-011]